MRSVINISLPKPLVGIVEQTVASGRYASKSEFFRSLLRLWMEKKLVEGINESRKELKSDRGKLLRSLGDLR